MSERHSAAKLPFQCTYLALKERGLFEVLFLLAGLSVSRPIRPLTAPLRPWLTAWLRTLPRKVSLFSCFIFPLPFPLNYFTLVVCPVIATHQLRDRPFCPQIILHTTRACCHLPLHACSFPLPTACPVTVFSPPATGAPSSSVHGPSPTSSSNRQSFFFLVLSTRNSDGPRLSIFHHLKRRDYLLLSLSGCGFTNFLQGNLLLHQLLFQTPQGRLGFLLLDTLRFAQATKSPAGPRTEAPRASIWSHVATEDGLNSFTLFSPLVSRRRLAACFFPCPPPSRW